MNVLILTPDRVGSTLLQRLITVYMLRKGFDQPIINLHELTNGLIKYYNETLKSEVLGKPEGTNWGYFQSLPEIVNLLKSVDHYKTSRLAHYHLVNRGDSIEDKIKFYEYLNKNFYIISCRRENLFEHALSWVIYTHSKHLNVYSPSEKVNIFYDLYHSGITAHKEQIFKYLDRYKSYIDWTSRHFDIQSYFEYGENIKDIEKYILNLDFMQGADSNTWMDMFGQSFKDFNTVSRTLPNLIINQPSKVSNQIELVDNNYISENKYNALKGADWPEYKDFTKGNLPDIVKNELNEFAIQTAKYSINTDEKTYNFLKTNIEPYQSTVAQLAKLVEDGFLVTSVPLKLQSLKEKQQIIKNYNQCLVWYNEWVDLNEFGTKQTEENLDQIASSEEIDLNLSINKLLK